MSSSELSSRFGKVVAVFRPSRGQTFAGVLLCGFAAIACFTVAALSRDLDDVNRACIALLGMGASGGAAAWIYFQGQWRLTIFASGLRQVRPGGVDELLWSEVREVVQTRVRAFGERTTRVTVVGPRTPIVVNPINCRARKRLFAALVNAAAQKGIAVRVEWEEID